MTFDESEDQDGIQWLGQYTPQKTPKSPKNCPKSPGFRILSPFAPVSSESNKNDVHGDTDSSLRKEGGFFLERNCIIVLPDEPNMPSTSSGRLSVMESRSKQTFLPRVSAKTASDRSLDSVSADEATAFERSLEEFSSDSFWDKIQPSFVMAFDVFMTAICTDSKVEEAESSGQVPASPHVPVEDNVGDQNDGRDADSGEVDNLEQESETDGADSESEDDTEEDVYYIPPENLEKLSELERKRLQTMLTLARELDVRISNAERYIQDDDLTENARIELAVRIKNYGLQSAEVCDAIAKLANFDSEDTETIAPPFKFRGSGHGYLDRCLTMYVQKLLGLKPKYSPSNGNADGKIISDGTTRSLTPKMVKDFIHQIQQLKQEGKPLVHRRTKKEIKYMDVFERLHEAIRDYRMQLFHEAILPKFAYDFEEHEMPSDASLEAKLVKPEEGAAEMKKYVEEFIEAAVAKGLAVERDAGDNDVVDPDFGDDEGEDFDEEEESSKKCLKSEQISDGTGSTTEAHMSGKSVEVTQLLRSDDPCCSKRKYDFVEEEEKENDETDQKRARSIDSDDAVAIAAAYAEDDEMQDYDDEIRNMLLEADFDEDDASS